VNNCQLLTEPCSLPLFIDSLCEYLLFFLEQEGEGLSKKDQSKEEGRPQGEPDRKSLTIGKAGQRLRGEGSGADRRTG